MQVVQEIRILSYFNFYSSFIAVHFSINEGATELPKHIKYSLRLPHEVAGDNKRWRTENTYPDFQAVGPRTGFVHNKHYNSSTFEPFNILRMPSRIFGSTCGFLKMFKDLSRVFQRSSSLSIDLYQVFHEDLRRSRYILWTGVSPGGCSAPLYKSRRRLSVQHLQNFFCFFHPQDCNLQEAVHCTFTKCHLSVCYM